MGGPGYTDCQNFVQFGSKYRFCKIYFRIWNAGLDLRYSAHFIKGKSEAIPQIEIPKSKIQNTY